MIKLEPISEINTSDVLFDTNLKQFCVYPNTEIHNLDVEYIKRNCLKVCL